MGEGLIETPTTWAQQEQRSWRLSSLNRGENRLGPHHHAGTSAKGGVINRAMHIRGVLT
jgi:hypothetical protein